MTRPSAIKTNDTATSQRAILCPQYSRRGAGQASTCAAALVDLATPELTPPPELTPLPDFGGCATACSTGGVCTQGKCLATSLALDYVCRLGVGVYGDDGTIIVQ